MQRGGIGGQKEDQVKMVAFKSVTVAPKVSNNSLFAEYQI